MSLSFQFYLENYGVRGSCAIGYDKRATPAAFAAAPANASFINNANALSK